MPFRIASAPGRGAPNPYVDLFYDALAPHGIELTEELSFRLEWLAEGSRRLDAIHLHWPESIWRRYNPARLARAMERRAQGSWGLHRNTRTVRKLGGVLYLLRGCRLVRRSGLRLLWTFHNVEHHEGADAVDRLGYRVLARCSDLIICHSESARAECRARYRPVGAVVVMPLGSYEGVFPVARPAAETLREIGLDAGTPVVSCLGWMRDYKGLDVACEAVAMLGDSVQLIVGGFPHADFDMGALQRRLTRVRRSALMPRTLSNQEFADYTAASEAALFPYRKITGSAALLTSLTLGRGVVASDLPYFREILSPEPAAGLLVSPGDPATWAGAITRYLALPSREREEAAHRLAHRYRWPAVIQPVVDVIHSWMTAAGRPPIGPRGLR